MKSLIVGLLSISLVGSVNAASTDTLHEVREKVVELRITQKEPPPAPVKKRKENWDRPRVETLPNQSLCTGAVISSNGLILTARHCVDDAADISVTFADNKEYRAVVLAISDRHDLALIHVDRFNIPYFEIAKDIVQGQTIYVMGNPVGITAALTQGIVAKRNGDVDFIDVTVLPGNSGGPAFDEEGRLVGITTAGIVVLYGFAHMNIMQSIDAILGFALEIQRSR